jgi:hypothetical protein
MKQMLAEMDELKREERQKLSKKELEYKRLLGLEDSADGSASEADAPAPSGRKGRRAGVERSQKEEDSMREKVLQRFKFSEMGFEKKGEQKRPDFFDPALPRTQSLLQTLNSFDFNHKSSLPNTQIFTFRKNKHQSQNN